MAARTWYDPSIRLFAEDGRATAARDDDTALDDWLASLSVGHFEQILHGLIDRLGGTPSALDRPVA